MIQLMPGDTVNVEQCNTYHPKPSSLGKIIKDLSSRGKQAYLVEVTWVGEVTQLMYFRHELEFVEEAH